MIAKLIVLVVPLGLDTFAVSAALAAAGLPAERRWRVSLLMAAFEAVMPLIGLALGAPLGRAIGDSAVYVAVAVLIAFGLYALLSSEGAEEEQRLRRFVEVTGWPTVVLGLSISLDELAVGFSLGLLRLPVLAVVILIAVQATIVSQLGLRIGARLSEHMREGAEKLAGAVLVILGFVLLLEELT